MKSATLLRLLLPAVLVTAPAALAAQASTVILVRHAEKAAPTGDPGLTAAGEARALALRDALRDYPVQGIYVTEFQRSRLTAAPTAAAFGLSPTVITARGREALAAATAQAIRALPPGSAALVVGHSNTLGPVIAALGGPAVPDLCDAEHATMFVLELASGQAPRLLRASYGRADSETC